MCVVALALDAQPDYRLVLAANRDELHARPSAALARWEGADSLIIAGRDLVSGGTWLGVSEAGRIAVVTNISTGNLPDPAKVSRGALVADYLREGKQPELAALDGYNAFSLLTIDGVGAPMCATLAANRPTPMITPLDNGIHGLSNGAPGEAWPRKDQLMHAFADCLHSQTDLPQSLFALLASESIDNSIFIRDKIYGTRCSTIVLVDRKGTGVIWERRFDASGGQSGETKIAFVLQDRA